MSVEGLVSSPTPSRQFILSIDQHLQTILSKNANTMFVTRPPSSSVDHRGSLLDGHTNHTNTPGSSRDDVPSSDSTSTAFHKFKNSSRFSPHYLNIPPGLAFKSYLEKWGPEQVIGFLAIHGCEHHSGIFIKNSIDGKLLLDLDMGILTSLGITKVGERIRLMAGIKCLRQRVAHEAEKHNIPSAHLCNGSLEMDRVKVIIHPKLSASLYVHRHGPFDSGPITARRCPLTPSSSADPEGDPSPMQRSQEVMKHSFITRSSRRQVIPPLPPGQIHNHGIDNSPMPSLRHIPLRSGVSYSDIDVKGMPPLVTQSTNSVFNHTFAVTGSHDTTSCLGGHLRRPDYFRSTNDTFQTCTKRGDNTISELPQRNQESSPSMWKQSGVICEDKAMRNGSLFAPTSHKHPFAISITGDNVMEYPHNLPIKNGPSSDHLFNFLPLMCRLYRFTL